MKKLLYSVAILLVAAFTACDDYVDITPTGKKTVDSADAYLQLVAFPARSYYPTAFAMLTDNAWILESNVIGNESLTWDGINTTFNEGANRLQLSDNNLYENPYKYILRENIVIGNVDYSGGDEAVKRLAKAEARVMRAWDHFILVNTFAKAYNPATASTDGGIAIMGEYNLEAVPVKSSVADVYSWIINELEQAVPDLQETPMDVYHPSLAFGYAFLAKVYLFHHEWQKAKEAAEKSMALNSTLADYVALKEAGGPTKSTMYAKGDNPEILNYAFQGSTTDNPAYVYGMISPELVNLFEADDLRFSLFFITKGTKYTFDEGSGAALWNSALTYKKFFYGTVCMRTAEVYLIKAEAEARLGNTAEALSLVNTLREKRIEGEAARLSAPSTQKDMMDIIITERRKELLFGFNRFWDLKRLNVESEYAKTITRTFPIVSTAVEHKTYSLAPGSRLYVIPFPESVRLMNSNMTLNTDE